MLFLHGVLRKSDKSTTINPENISEIVELFVLNLQKWIQLKYLHTHFCIALKFDKRKILKPNELV